MTTARPQPERRATPTEDGNVSATGAMVPAAMWRCCAAMDPEEVGDCGEGCCTDYRCRNCGRSWRHEWSV
jgi:hypothetical protein